MGEEKHDGLAIPGHIVLAHEPPFTIGELRVDPGSRQIERHGKQETLEPRVMQVLVALGRAKGAIVTRDELTDWCWGGRIVGEDAINRAIFRLRQVAAGVGASSFTIETITKVGYRIVTGSLETRTVGAPENPPGQVIGRRAAVIGGSALTAALVGGILWQKPWGHQARPEAVEAFRRGDLAQKAGTPEQSLQSISYFDLAVRLDPDYAQAWGALALAYTHNVDSLSDAELASLPARVRPAARRALQLDPDNPDAQLALACIPPFFRNWQQMEPELRRIRDRFPHHWLANGRLAALYYQVGRLIEGAELHKKVIAIDPMIPGAYSFAANALSSAGRIQEADAILDAARERWPTNPWVWYAQFQHLLFSGRPAATTALATDPDALPINFVQRDLLTLARGVERREPKDVEAAIRFLRSDVLTDVRNVWSDVPIVALLGRIDLAFAMMERYFLNRGAFGSSMPIHPYTRRFTDFLYSMPMATVRADPRYRDLTQAIGLDDYWRWAKMAPPHFPA